MVDIKLRNNISKHFGISLFKKIKKKWWNYGVVFKRVFNEK